MKKNSKKKQVLIFILSLVIVLIYSSCTQPVGLKGKNDDKKKKKLDLKYDLTTMEGFKEALGDSEFIENMTSNSQMQKAPGTAILGDVDGSGIVDIVDALLTAQYYVGQDLTNFNPDVADVNGDTFIDIVDSLLIAQYYVGEITVFPVETDIVWEQKIDNSDYEWVTEMAIDSAGNIYAIGLFENSLTQQDWWIKKFDSNGKEDTINWNKEFDAAGYNDQPYSIAVDSNDNIYVVGAGIDLVDPDSGYDWWIKKFDNNGNEDTINWNKKIDGNGGSDYAKTVLIDSNDNIYVIGRQADRSGLYATIFTWIKKYDSNGNEDTVYWDKGISTLKKPTCAVIDQNNNLFIAGFIDDNYGRDWWVTKFDSNGNEDIDKWNKRIDDINSFEIEGITVDKENNIYVTGSIDGGIYTHGRITKFSNNGVEYWTDTFSRAYGCDIAVDSSNNVYLLADADNIFGYDDVIGRTSSRDWLIKKYNPVGDEDYEWQKEIDGNYYTDRPECIIIDNNDFIYAGGYGTNIVSESSDHDLWIIKFKK